MSRFTNTDSFNLNFQELIELRASAYNVNGWGEASDPNTAGAVVLTTPRFMNKPLRDPLTND